MICSRDPVGCGISRNDGYAGDAAWREWFDICSVDGCSSECRELLRAEVRSAMYAQLARYGLSREEAGDDDPVAFFDGYFKLKGSRERGKPLKLYFAHRIREEGMRLFDFVCGTLFGSRSGRIHDIVIDWISSLKGWKPRMAVGADGSRRLTWEKTGESDKVIELPVDTDPAAMVDIEPVRETCRRLLVRLSDKIGVEKRKVALLLFVTAQDIPLTELSVLETLGVGKSMAYRMRDKALAVLRREMTRTEGAEDPLFGRLLLEVCEKEGMTE